MWKVAIFLAGVAAGLLGWGWIDQRCTLATDRTGWALLCVDRAPLLPYPPDRKVEHT